MLDHARLNGRYHVVRRSCHLLASGQMFVYRRVAGLHPSTESKEKKYY